MSRGKVNKHLFYIIGPTIILLMNYDNMRAYAPFSIYLNILLLACVGANIYFMLRKSYTYNILNLLCNFSMALCTAQIIYVHMKYMGRPLEYLFVFVLIAFTISTGMLFLNCYKNGFMEKSELK